MFPLPAGAATAGTHAPVWTTETVERFRKYLAAPEKSHPFLTGWDRLRSSGAGADLLRPEAERFQALVNRRPSNEKKAIEEYNERVLEEAKKSKDPYDLFCKGCNVVTRSSGARQVCFVDRSVRRQAAHARQRARSSSTTTISTSTGF